MLTVHKTPEFYIRLILWKGDTISEDVLTISLGLIFDVSVRIDTSHGVMKSDRRRIPLKASSASVSRVRILFEYSSRSRNQPLESPIPNSALSSFEELSNSVTELVAGSKGTASDQVECRHTRYT